MIHCPELLQVQGLFEAFAVHHISFSIHLGQMSTKLENWSS